MHDFFPTIESVHSLEAESEQVIVNVAEEPSQQNDTFPIPKHKEEPAKEPEKKTCFICNYCGKQYEKKATFSTIFYRSLYIPRHFSKLIQRVVLVYRNTPQKTRKQQRLRMCYLFVAFQNER